MTKNEYLRKAQKAYDNGTISAEAYDTMVENVDVFCNEDDEDYGFLPRTYAEIEYDDMDTADEDKINSVEELNISNQLTLIPRRINFITEFTTLMLKICYEYDDVYWKIYHKLESLKSK